jgi:hypothetical protein
VRKVFGRKGLGLDFDGRNTSNWFDAKAERCIDGRI